MEEYGIGGLGLVVGLLLLLCFCMGKGRFKKEENTLPTHTRTRRRRRARRRGFVDLDDVDVDINDENDGETIPRTHTAPRPWTALPGNRSLYAEQTSHRNQRARPLRESRNANGSESVDRYLTIVPSGTSTVHGASGSIKIVPRSRPELPILSDLISQVPRRTNKGGNITVIPIPNLNVHRGISIVPKTGRFLSGLFTIAPSRGYTTVEIEDEEEEEEEYDFTPEIVEVVVTKVLDGDGVQTYNYQRNETLDIRLIGIDAPEIKGNQPFAKEAKHYLESMVLNETVILTTYDLDQYDRVLGSLEVEGKVENVSLEMLKAGLAEVYKGKGKEYGGRRNEFFEAEGIAKSQRKGFWALDNVVLPSEFKRRERNMPSQSGNRCHGNPCQTTDVAYPLPQQLRHLFDTGIYGNS